MKKFLTVCLTAFLLICLLSPVVSAADIQKSEVPEAPVIRSVTAVSGTEVAVNWTATSGADSYRIYIKQGNLSWKTLADVKGTSYNCAVDSSSWGLTVQIKVRAINSETGKNTLSEAASTVMRPQKVKLTGISPVDYHSNKIGWQIVSGAQCYKLYRKVTTGGWNYLGTINSGSTSSYTDRTAVMGNSYYYTVRACWKQGNKIQDGVVDGRGLYVQTKKSTPSVRASRNSAGINVSWTSIAGAQGYQIYRKEGTGSSYKAIANIQKSNQTSWVDTSVRAGVTYTYTVKAYCKVGDKVFWSDYDRKGASAQGTLVAPSFKSVQQAANGSVSISWRAVSNALYYDVYRKTSANGSWQKISRVSGTSCTLSNCRQTDRYTVVAVNSSARSGYDKEGVYLGNIPKAPELLKAYGADGNTVIHWETQQNADAYYAYRKTAGSAWNKVGGLAGTYNVTLYDRTAQAGTTYAYTVRARKIADGVLYIGGYDSRGITVRTELGEPVMKTLEYDTGQKGWTLTWTKVKYAQKYFVYRKQNNSWSMVGQTENNSLRVSGDSKDQSVYTVKAVGSAGGKMLYSTYDRTGMTVSERRYSQLSVLFEGDSITAGAAIDSGRYSGVTYPQRIGQNLGCTVSNQAVNGSVLGDIGQLKQKSLLYRLENGTVKYSGYDVICIGIGTNDFADNLTLGNASDNENASTFYGYLKKAILLIRRQNPDADIVFVTPIYRGRVGDGIYNQKGYDFKNENGNTLRQFCTAIKKVAGQYEKVYVYDSEKENVINADNYLYACFDSLHPTQKYYGLIGNSITDFLTGLPAVQKKENRS